MKLFNNVFKGLQKNMDLGLFRQSLINANIANVETPKYRPVDVHFKDELGRMMGLTDEKMSATAAGHFDAAPDFNNFDGEIIRQAGEVSPDQNAVDLDRQMAELAGNAFDYRSSAKIISKKMALMKYVITQTR